MLSYLQLKRKMKGVLYLAFVGLFLASCGEDTPVDTIKLTTNKDKISYCVGADHAKELVKDKGFGDFDHEQIIRGFELGLNNEEAFDQACQQTLQSMFGNGGMEFNPDYKTEGSLCIGKLFGANFKRGWKQENFIMKFDLELVKAGFRSAIEQSDTLVDLSERDAIIKKLIGDLNQKVFAQATKKETAFFANVQKIPGIKMIPGGIYIETIAEGKGGSPAVGDDVESRYVLISPTGDTLESSLAGEKAGQPIPTFSLNGVIQGWSMAFPTLKKGGKYRLYVPQGLAYGANPPQGSPIAQFSPLIFYVELLNYGKPGTLAKPMPQQGMR